MNGGSNNCATADNDVSVYDTANSTYGHAVEQPPANDTQLGIIAGQNGCLYSGPTQITLSTDANGNGQMTVVSPDTIEGTQTVNGTTYAWDTNNITGQREQLPQQRHRAPALPTGSSSSRTPPRGQTQAWANPFDDPTYNSVTNLTITRACPCRPTRCRR